MTGNDIIDIKVAGKESNWKRKGFLEKIFTPQERIYINEAVDSEKMVWTLWSMKESAYKAYTRQFGGRFFAPQKINCTLLSTSKGSVTINEISYKTTSRTTDNYIYSIANHCDTIIEYLVNHCFLNKNDDYKIQQQHIYQRVINSYAAVSGKQTKYLAVIKDTHGIPSIHCKGEQLTIPVTISHHGYYSAFIIN